VRLLRQRAGGDIDALATARGGADDRHVLLRKHHDGLASRAMQNDIFARRSLKQDSAVRHVNKPSLWRSVPPAGTDR
jgi:hypothetical protein